MAIPMTVVGGYLGAGKTTLVNAVLSSAAMRIAVVVNDFGAVNVDADLINSRSGDIIELTNGCVCCSLQNGMAAVMARLGAMDPPPDHILVEVSGVGDPAPVIAWADHPGFRRHGVVACADAETVRDKATDRWVADTVVRQLESADILHLTKTELVSSVDAVEVRDWLHSVAAGTPVYDDREAVIARLLDPTPMRVRAVAEPIEPAHVAEDTHVTCSASTVGGVDLDRVRGFLADLPAEAVRVKGVLRTLQSPDRRTVVNVAGRRVEITDDGPWIASHASHLVVICSGVASVHSSLEADLALALTS